MMYLLLAKPNVTPSMNHQELANEWTVLLCGYINFLYTDFVPDDATRYQVGWWHIGIFMMNLSINLCFMGADTC